MTDTQRDRDAKEREESLFTSFLKVVPWLAWLVAGIDLTERLSFYGNKAELMHYLQFPKHLGGLAMPIEASTDQLGTYLALIYVATVLGGAIADRWIGTRRAVLIGSLTVAVGHLVMPYSILSFMILVVVGTGLFKPNLVNLLREINEKAGLNETQQGLAQKLLYIAVNAGALMGKLLVPWLIHTLGAPAQPQWHRGFRAATVAILLAVLACLFAWRELRKYGNRKDRTIPALPATATGTLVWATEPQTGKLLSAQEWGRMGALLLLFMATCAFWLAAEQADIGFTLFADKYVDCQIGGWRFPSAMIGSVNPLVLCGFLLYMVFRYLRKPHNKNANEEDTRSIILGLFLNAMSTLLMVPAAILAAAGEKVSFLWLVAINAGQAIGEGFLSPVGLALVARLAPRRFSATIIGLWFLSSAIAQKYAAKLAGVLFGSNATAHTVMKGYGLLVAGMVALVICLDLLYPYMLRLMGEKPKSGYIVRAVRWVFA